MVTNSIHWFRKGLRLHDNPSLADSLLGADTVRCVYILDPWFAGSSNVGIHRWRFLLQSLQDLDSSLRKHHSRLFVIRGQPTDVFPRLFKEWNTSRLSYEYDSEPFGKERDAAIRKLACEAGVEVTVRVSHTLYDPDRIIELNGGQSPLTYKRFQTLIGRMESVEMPAESVADDVMGKCRTPMSEDHDDKFGVPSLEELGFDTEGLSSAVWPGGETEALARLERHLERKVGQILLTYLFIEGKRLEMSLSAPLRQWDRLGGEHAVTITRRAPPLVSDRVTVLPSGVGRQLRASQNERQLAARQPDGPQPVPALRLPLLPPLLLQAHRPLHEGEEEQLSPALALRPAAVARVLLHGGHQQPSLRQDGEQPHLRPDPVGPRPRGAGQVGGGPDGLPLDRRHHDAAEAGGLDPPPGQTRRGVFPDPRGPVDRLGGGHEGAPRNTVFEELLLDADWSVNAGSWMWLSCSSFFQQFFHCYCPVGFGRRADPNGDYIRRYLPILRGFPAEYIYDPWNAPESVQKAAECVIGVHYPKPMVNHAHASRLNIERMKQIYQQLSCCRGFGLLASVPSTCHGTGETSSNGMAFPVEAPHADTAPSGPGLRKRHSEDAADGKSAKVQRRGAL
uniref:cryptochrome-1-like isoform X2 n=1 Tax=Gasterosteus aculeatus aculeatus TaxID=481459 RepID=UPI001A987E96|nr:cryptochrome-1-like isoform X2 [Gasterosteus aculeatus aculeatus]